MNTAIRTKGVPPSARAYTLARALRRLLTLRFWAEAVAVGAIGYGAGVLLEPCRQWVLQ